MNQAIIQAKIKLAENKNKYQSLNIDATGILDSIYMCLDKYNLDKSAIKTEELVHFSKKLHETVTEMRSLKEQIQEIEKDLA